MTNETNPIERLNISHYFLFMILALFLVFCYKMVAPYLDPVIMAFLLSIMANPAYLRLKARLRGKSNIAAFLSCILLTLVIVVPFVLISSAVIRQGILSFNAINHWIDSGNLERFTQTPMVADIMTYAEKQLTGDLFQDIDLKAVLLKVSSFSGEFLVNQGGYLIANISSVTGKFFLMLFVFFFVVKDQKKIFDYLFHLMPMSSAHETILVEKIEAVAKSALLGTLVTSGAQGIAGGIAFTICGLPGFFWGTVMAFASLVPLVGTAIIWLPAAGFLLVSGAIKSGIFLIIWSVVVVGTIDNIVRPLFMKGSADMSTLLIFFSILGGLNYFGLIGLFYGPLIFGITMVLLYIYDLEFHSFLNHQDNH